jgi:F420-non-reducing hydrogenase iron-sulfur subunit
MSRSGTEIVVFACNWDGLSCVEGAAQAGLSYPASVKPVRISCLSRVHRGLILRAFELGADGVMLLGCEPGNCHFNVEAGLIEDECRKAASILALLGIDERRLVLARMPRGDGAGFVERVKGFAGEVASLRAAVPSRA